MGRPPGPVITMEFKAVSKKIYAAFTLVLLTLAAPSVCPADGPFWEAQWWRDRGMAERLQLTRHEVGRLDQAHQRMRMDLQQAQSAVNVARHRLDRLMRERHLNMAAVEMELNALERASAEVASGRYRYQLKIRRILGPERYAVATGWERPGRPDRWPSGR